MSQPQLLRAFPFLPTRSLSTSLRSFQEARPPTAPKQSPNISHIRRNVKLYEDNAVHRNYVNHRNAPNDIAANRERAASLLSQLDGPRARIRALQAQLMKSAEDKAETLKEIKQVKEIASRLENELNGLDTTARSLALGLPNLTSPETPLNGEPEVISYINYSSDRVPSYPPSADHSSIGEKLQLLDFASASMTAGWGFYYLLNEAALLEQALIQYALSVAIRRGWKAVTPPSVVYTHITESCGFQPRDQHDEQQIWHVAQSDKDKDKPKRSLAATAEIPLAGLYASKAIPEQNLPIKVIGVGRCYRAEAGSRGVDTRGLYRVHEFTKVEMFGWADAAEATNPTAEPHGSVSTSTMLLDEMVHIQTEILASLGLPCRVLEMPSSDLGASAYRKIDIEALFPSRLGRDEGWGEVTSASICTDYQSRRLDTRILDKNGSRKRFAQTVNGTAMAIPRVLAAILEHGWQEEQQCVVIPQVLRSFMGGLDKICSKTQ